MVTQKKGQLALLMGQIKKLDLIVLDASLDDVLSDVQNIK